MMISVIVPVYNVEQYLPACLDSILSQTYDNIEVILIDDGSTDNSSNICDTYSKRDKRVLTVHHPNRGVSYARNTGIGIAHGEYISFCDSDDVIVSNLYEELISRMDEYMVDRVISGYAYLYSGGRTVYCKPRIPDGKYEAKDILKDMIDDGTLSGFRFSGVNNSLFRKCIIDSYNIRFNENLKYNEDSLFSLEYMLHSKYIYSMQTHPTYYYRQHYDSATKRIIENKYTSLHKALDKLQLNNRDIEYEIQIKRRMITEALWQILDICQHASYTKAYNLMRNLLSNEELQKNMLYIETYKLNKYKKVYYYLMKYKAYNLLYILTKRVFPFASKHISR